MRPQSPYISMADVAWSTAPDCTVRSSPASRVIVPAVVYRTDAPSDRLLMPEPRSIVSAAALTLAPVNGRLMNCCREVTPTFDPLANGASGVR